MQNDESYTPITKALHYLSRNQSRDGSFVSYTSPTENNFLETHVQPATFLSILILQCLHNIAGSEAIQEKLSAYILHHKSPHWTWNYIERPNPSSYPDDLDDTACALGALSYSKSQLIDGAVLGNFAQALIHTETQAGGPYNTWLIDTIKRPLWRDVDLAVNANIGWFLAKQGVKLDGLMDYIDNAIAENKITSSYYPDDAALLYFLSRWYDGKQKEALLVLTEQAFQRLDPTSNPLHLALLLSSGVRLGMPSSILEPITVRLITAQHAQGDWDAIGLFYDPTIKGRRHYGGAKTLTTAFAIEALANYASHSVDGDQQSQKVRKIPVRIPAMVSLDTNVTSLESLRQSYRKSLRAVIQQDSGQQITKIASITAAACKQKIAPKTINHLNAASLNGWLAYNIFDDILDEESRPEQLSVATYAARAMQRHFQEALPKSPEFTKYTESVFTQMDSANHWEVTETRVPVNNKHIYLQKLPDYGKKLDSLWQRSWGHSLASSGVLLALGYGLQANEQLQLQRFFQHFLVARQLNDDAHDWEVDLSEGHISAVLTLLLKPTVKSSRIDLSRDLPRLWLHFWKTTITEVHKLIQEHITRAYQAMADCDAVVDPGIFQSWLRALSDASTKAIQQSEQAEKFIATYSRQ